LTCVEAEVDVGGAQSQGRSSSADWRKLSKS
jgi:hypothetical protein